MKRLSVIAAPCFWALSLPAYTQASEENIQPVLEEVIVTATRSGSTSLQKTPLSITAIDREQLSQSNISQIKDMAFLVPNLVISQNAAWGQVFIRGVGTNNIFAGGDPSSTIHLDGVYIARPAMVFNEYLGLQRVEVIRGPQGTLFGRNSTGGTINYISRQPSDEAQATVEVDVGTFDKRHIEGYFNAEVTSMLSANLAVNSHKRDGYIDGINANGPDSYGDEDYHSGRATLRFSADDTLEFLLSYDFFERDQQALQHKNSLQYTDGSPAIGGAMVIDDFWTLNTPHPGLFQQSIKGLNATLNWQFSDDWHLRSITAHRSFDMFAQGDLDYTEVANRYSNVREDHSQFSQEIIFTLNNATASWVNGLFYFKEDDAMNFWAELETERDAAELANFTTFIDGESITEAIAVYSDLTWHWHNKLDVIIGARYSWEKKDFQSIGHLDRDGVIIPTVNNDDDESWTRLTPRLGINYFQSESVTLFALLSTGFKSGGFNFFNLVDGKERFEPETITALELGIKADTWNQRLRINASAFYSDYEDLQVQQFFAASANAPPTSVIENAAAAVIQGVELELTLFINQHWDIQGHATWLDASYEDFELARTSNPDDIIDASGNALNNAPEYSFMLINNFYHTLGAGQMHYRLEYKWQDTIYFTPFNDAATSQPAYGLINASISWYSPQQHWQVMAYGKNISNEAYISAIQDISFTDPSKGGSVAGVINPPRTVGLRVSYSYR